MKGNMEKEIEIIKKAARGNKQAWEFIHKKYKKALLAFIQYHFTRIDQMEAEDILQETWENIIKKEKLKNYDPGKISFYRYLINITRFEIFHYFDRKYKKFRIKGEDHKLILINEADLREQNTGREESLSEERLSVLFYERLVEQNEIDADDVMTLIELYPRAGPPHQLLAFGFNRLISHWRKKPQKIAFELSNEFLKNLTDILIEDFVKEIHKEIPDKKADPIMDFHIKDCFKPLKDCMCEIVGQVLSQRDDKSRYQIDLMKITGETLLMEYYTGKPEKHISDWTDKVIKRLTKLWKEVNVTKCVNLGN